MDQYPRKIQTIRILDDILCRLYSLVLTIVPQLPNAIINEIANYASGICWWCKKSECVGIHTEDEEELIVLSAEEILHKFRCHRATKYTLKWSGHCDIEMNTIKLELERYFNNWSDWIEYKRRIFPSFSLDCHLRWKSHGNATHMWFICDPDNLSSMGGQRNGDLDLLVKSLWSWMDLVTFTSLFPSPTTSKKKKNIGEKFEIARSNWILWMTSLSSREMSECVKWYNARKTKSM